MDSVVMTLVVLIAVLLLLGLVIYDNMKDRMERNALMLDKLVTALGGDNYWISERVVIPASLSSLKESELDTVMMLEKLANSLGYVFVPEKTEKDTVEAHWEKKGKH